MLEARQPRSDDCRPLFCSKEQSAGVESTNGMRGGVDMTVVEQRGSAAAGVDMTVVEQRGSVAHSTSTIENTTSTV